jgi:hypothetical protein
MKSFVASYSSRNFPKCTLPAHIITLKTENLRERRNEEPRKQKIYKLVLRKRAYGHQEFVGLPQKYGPRRIG